jgi:prepilin-type N-terminal cleavage/methylation domain-containing protein
MKFRNQGITLVELMVVVAIISILSLLAYPAYQNYITTARQAAARGNLEPLRLAVEDFRLDNMAAGYAALDGLVWDPAGSKTLETTIGWKPDGDEDKFTYSVSATATGYTITVSPVGYSSDVQTFTK